MSLKNKEDLSSNKTSISTQGYTLYKSKINEYTRYIYYLFK